MLATLSLALTLLLGEINVCPTTLCGFHFQSVCPTLILPDKRVSVRENAQKRVLLAFLSKQTWLLLNNIYYLI